MTKNISIIIVFFLLIISFSCDNETIIIEPENPTKVNISATKILDSLILEDSRNASLYFERSKYYFNNNFQPKALVDILSAIKLDSSKINYYLLGGEIFLEMKQGKDAIKLLEEGININSNSEELLITAVEYNVYMNDFEKALILSNDLLKLNVNNADAYFFKGIIFKGLNKEKKAISNFQTCVEQDPTFYNAYMQLGLIFSENKNDLAITYFNNAMKLEQNSREAAYGKAFHYQRKNELNKAKAEYFEMIRNNRKDYQAIYNMGYCYFEQDSLKKAHKHFQTASSIKLDYVDAIYMMAQIEERVGDIRNAKIHYNTALKMLPENEDIINALEALKTK